MPPPRQRAGIASVMVFEAFATTDGEIVVAAANDRLFAKLADIVGRPEWKTDPKYMEAAACRAHRVNTLAQDMAHPQILASGMLHTDPRSGLSLTGMPMSFNGVRLATSRLAPELGEHNHEIVPARVGERVDDER
ncbi:hypothetical protein BH09PSE5_BH09PSE5_33880 [soil metagenome]